MRLFPSCYSIAAHLPHPEEHRVAMRLEGWAIKWCVFHPSRRARRALLRVRTGEGRDSMRGRQVFFETLINHGVDRIFGNPGTTESPLLDSLLDYPQLKYIVHLH